MQVLPRELGFEAFCRVFGVFFPTAAGSRKTPLVGVMQGFFWVLLGLGRQCFELKVRRASIRDAECWS